MKDLFYITENLEFMPTKDFDENLDRKPNLSVELPKSSLELLTENEVNLLSFSPEKIDQLSLMLRQCD